METRRSPVGYIVVGVIAIVLISWLTYRYLVKRSLLRDLGTNDMQLRVDSARELLVAKKLEDSLPAQPIIRRSKTAQALGEVAIGHPEDAEEAMRILGIILRDQEDAPRRWARQALEKLGERAVPTLLAALPAGGSTTEEAIAALKSDELKKLRPTVARKLRFFLSDGGSRAGAATALGQVGGPGIDALIRGCYNDDKDGLRVQCLNNLGLVGAKEAIGACLYNLEPLGKSKKGEAIKALGLIGDRSAVPHIIPFLTDVDNRTAAATALGLIGDPRAVEPILATLNDSDKGYRPSAILALGPSRIGAPAIPALVRELRSPHVLVRRGVAQALVVPTTQKLTPQLIAELRRATPGVAAALGDPDREVRAAAALALGWHHNLDGVAPLVAVLGDPSWQVVDAAVEALGQIGLDAIGRLQNVLRDPGQSVTVRYQVARALAAMGRPAVDELVAALSPPDPELQRWSAVALGLIGSTQPRVIKALEQLEETGSGDLKWVASEQLRRLRRLSTS
jgi:HEAT repeat protein